MRLLVRLVALAAPVALLIPLCGFSRDPAQMLSTDVIVTAAPVYLPLAAMRGEEQFPGRATAAGSCRQRGVAGHRLCGDGGRQCLLRWQKCAIRGQADSRRSLADMGIDT